MRTIRVRLTPPAPAGPRRRGWLDALVQDVAAQLREDPGNLAEQVVAVAAGEGPQILTVPSPPAVVSGGGAIGQRRYLGGEARIQEEREREPAMAAQVADPVRCRAVPPAGEAVEHVADIADERAGDGRRVDPALGRGDLQATAVILGQQGEQPVVGMLAHSPVLGPRWRWR